MTWEDAFKFATAVVAAIGGGGVIAGIIGNIWVNRLRGNIETELKRLDAALKHRGYVLQRFAEYEMGRVGGLLARGTRLPAID